jgi:hypothetical protein
MPVSTASSQAMTDYRAGALRPSRSITPYRLVMLCVRARIVRRSDQRGPNWLQYLAVAPQK